MASEMQIIFKRRHSENRSENRPKVTEGQEQGKDKLRDWDWHIDITIYKIDN